MPELWLKAKAGTSRGPGHPDLTIKHSAQVRLSHVCAEQVSGHVRHALANRGLLFRDSLKELIVMGVIHAVVSCTHWR